MTRFIPLLIRKSYQEYRCASSDALFALRVTLYYAYLSSSTIFCVICGGGAKNLNKFKIDDFDKHCNNAQVEDAFVDEEVVEERRGFVPSDVKDPGKREFLTQLRN